MVLSLEEEPELREADLRVRFDWGLGGVIRAATATLTLLVHWGIGCVFGLVLFAKLVVEEGCVVIIVARGCHLAVSGTRVLGLDVGEDVGGIWNVLEAEIPGFGEGRGGIGW